MQVLGTSASFIKQDDWRACDGTPGLERPHSAGTTNPTLMNHYDGLSALDLTAPSAPPALKHVDGKPRRNRLDRSNAQLGRSDRRQRVRDRRVSKLGTVDWS